MSNECYGHTRIRTITGRCSAQSRWCWLVLAAAWFLAQPSVVRAQQGWASRESVSSGALGLFCSRSTPDVAVDPQGNATVVWWDGTHVGPSACNYQIRWGRRDVATGRWQSGVLDTGGAGPSGVISVYGPPIEPTIAVDASGNVTAIWVSSAGDSDPQTLKAARWRSGATAWTPPQTLANQHLRCSSMDVDAQGNVLLAWVDAAGVRAVRFDAENGQWGIANTLADSTTDPSCPISSFGPAGDATVAWVSHGTIVQARRYDVPTGQWGPTENLSVDRPVESLVIAADIALWAQHDGSAWVVQASQYADGGWSVATDVSARTHNSYRPHLGHDGAGTVFASWSRGDLGIEASRHTDAGWEPPRTLSGSAEGGRHTLEVDRAGNATVVWREQTGDILAVRFEAQVGTWGDPVAIAAGHPILVKSDTRGNLIALWTASLNAIGGARYCVDTGLWRLADVFLSPYPQRTHLTGGADLAFDAAGNAVAAAAIVDYGPVPSPGRARLEIDSHSWRATPGVPTIADITPSPGTLTVHLTPAENPEPAFVPSTYAYSVDNGATWTTREPASLALPIVIGGLHDGVTYDVRVRAINGVGPGTASQARRATPGAVPGPPAIEHITPSPGTLTVYLEPAHHPESAFPPFTYAYSLDDGATWTAREPASIMLPIVIGGLHDGVSYLVRVRAINVIGSGPASLAHCATPGAIPDPPTGLAVTSLVGNTLTLGWSQRTGAASVTGYRIEAGLSSGETLVSLLTGTTAPTFAVTAPSGVFYVRAVAMLGSLRSEPSNEIRVVVNAPEVPSAPKELRALVDDASLMLSWTNTFTGGAPTSLWLQVTGRIETVLPLSLADRFTYAPVPPGVYTLRVVAANAYGISAPSNSVTLQFPQPCSGAPGMPTDFHTWRVDRTLFLSWNQPASGPPAASYSVWVGGGYVGRFRTTGRTMSGSAAQGTYTLTVTADNACGTGPPTSTLVVTIP